MKRFAAYLLVIAALFGCTGCLDARSLDHYGYVLAIGFDRGETLPYSVTLLLQKTKTESESQNNSGFSPVKAECRSLLEGIQTLSAGLPFEISLSRTSMIVVEASLLMEPEFLQNLSDLPYSRLFIRYNTTLYVSLSPAYDTLEGLSNELDPNLNRISMNITAYSKNTGLIPLAHLSMLTEAIQGQSYDLALPLCGIVSERGPNLHRDSVGLREYAYIGGSLALKSEMKTSLAGAALLSDSRIVGFLDGQNVQLMMMASGEYREGRRMMKDPMGNTVSIYLRADRRPQTTLTFADGKARAHVDIPLAAYVETTQGHGGDEREMAPLIAQTLAAEMDAVFACCRDLGSDVMGFGKHAVRHFRTARDWEAFDWRSAYMRMDATFAFNIKLLHNLEETGLE